MSIASRRTSWFIEKALQYLAEKMMLLVGIKYREKADEHQPAIP